MSAASPLMVASLRRAFATEPGVRLAMLFGSHAKGTARESSDVDVAVIAPDVDRLALAASLTRAIAHQVDVVDLSDPSVPLLEELVRDAVVVHQWRPGEGALWRSRVLAQLEIDRPWYGRMRDAWLARVARQGLSGW